VTSRKPAAAEATPSGRANQIPLLIVIGIVSSVIVLILAGQNPWNVLFINPLINALVLLDILVFGQFGMAIIVFTVLLRLATLPFTIRQLESTKAMQAAQPRMQEIQKKYKDPKRRQEEMIKLYREQGINPLGCIMPMAIQMVVFIALYRALVYVVGGSPESLIGLSQRLYPLDFLQGQIPLEQHFLWLNLGTRDTTLILPLMVGVSTYVQQRMTITPNATPEQQQQQQMMTWMLPAMLTFFTLSLPSGVGVYWVTSNIFQLFAGYFVYGRRILSWRQLLPFPAPTTATVEKKPADGEAATERDSDIVVEQEADQQSEDGGLGSKARRSHGKRRGKRKNRR
jgi:YidC/Oxa1 family membrane protein insertase